jgi:hypothetical protein
VKKTIIDMALALQKFGHVRRLGPMAGHANKDAGDAPDSA